MKRGNQLATQITKAAAQKLTAYKKMDSEIELKTGALTQVAFAV